MLQPEINWDICQVCYPCEAREVCKPRAIHRIDIDEPPWIEMGLCSRCGLCVSACQFGAIGMRNQIGKDGALPRGCQVR